MLKSDVHCFQITFLQSAVTFVMVAWKVKDTRFVPCLNFLLILQNKEPSIATQINIVWNKTKVTNKTLKQLFHVNFQAYQLPSSVCLSWEIRQLSTQKYCDCYHHLLQLFYLSSLMQNLVGPPPPVCSWLDSSWQQECWNPLCQGYLLFRNSVFSSF